MSKEASKSRRDDMPGDVSGLSGWRQVPTAAELSSVKVPTRRITINLDSDIIAVFKAEALGGGAPYQVAINQALRSYLRDREAQQQEACRNALLSALEDPAVKKKIRAIAAKK